MIYDSTTGEFILNWLLILLELLPALMIVCVGGWFLHIHLNKRSKLFHLSDSIRSRISKLEEKCGDYWLDDLNDTNKRTSQEIKSLIGSIARDLSAWNSKRSFMCRKQKYTDLLHELFSEATGGEFETSDRQPSPERYWRICNKCQILSSEIIRDSI